MATTNFETNGKFYGRISFPALFEPKAPQNKPDGEKKFSVTIIMPKDDKTSMKLYNAAKKAVEEAKRKGAEKCKEWAGKIPAKLDISLRDGDDPEYADKPEEYRNAYFVNLSCSAKNKPTILGPNKQPITDQSDIYPGCWCYVSYNAYAYGVSGNKGIAFGLNNVLKYADAESFAGRPSATAEFADIEAQEFDVDGDDAGML